MSSVVTRVRLYEEYEKDGKDIAKERGEIDGWRRPVGDQRSRREMMNDDDGENKIIENVAPKRRPKMEGRFASHFLLFLHTFLSNLRETTILLLFCSTFMSET